LCVQVHLDAFEKIQFNFAFNEIAKQSFDDHNKVVRKRYVQILQEQEIDIISELNNASYKSSDEKACEYLRKVNLRLRKHIEYFPTYYNNPKRLPRQKGPLKKPKSISAINVNWSED
jgi:isocitrate/isopropylmalate dehydrogenase